MNLSNLRSAIANFGSVVLALGMVSSSAAQATSPADAQEHSDPAAAGPANRHREHKSFIETEPDRSFTQVSASRR